MQFLRNYLLCFIAILCVDISDSNKSLLSDIHNMLFQNSSCVYLITDSSNWTWRILTLNSQFVTVSLQQFKKFILRKLPFTCNGYILMCEKHEDINNLFSSININQFFIPHQTVLLLRNNSIQLNITEIHKATELQNLELVIVTKDINQTQGVSLRHGIIDNIKYFTKKYYYRWIPHKILEKYNRTFSVVYFNCSPFAKLDTTSNISSGVELEMMKETLRDWPKKFVFLQQIDGLIRNSHADSIKLIARNEFDAALCAHWIHKQLPELYVTRTNSYLISCVTLLVPRPLLLPDHSFIFQPFQATMWSVYFATMLTTIYASHAALRLINKIEQIDLSYSIGIIRLLSLGGFTRLSYLKYSTVRVLLVTLSMYSLLLSIYFCAGLSKCLRFPRFSNKLNNIDDILENNLKWTSSGGANFFQGWMNQTRIPKLEKLAKNFESFQSLSERNEMIRQRNHGLLVQTCAEKSVNYVMYSEILDRDNRNILKMINENFACFYIALPMRYNSPYVKIFNQAYAKYTEYGFIKYWLQKYVNTKEYRYMNLFSRTYSDEVRQYLTLEKLQGIFYFLLAGHGLASVVFLCEKWVVV